MGRKRRPQGAFTFELVPDDAEVTGLVDVPGPGRQDGSDDPGPGGDTRVRERTGALARAWRSVPRRTRWGLAVATVALVGTGVVVDASIDQDREAALRAAAGGVVDLTVPPHEVWRIEDSGGDPGLPGGLVAVTGGVAAVQRFDELVGVDVATGEERWTVDLTDRASTCGPGLTFWSDAVDLTRASRIVCLGDVGAEGTTVTVVEEDGTVLARRALPGSYDLAVPGPGTSVLTAQWVGTADDVDVELRGDPMTELTVLGEIDDGYDLLVRLVDAVTGEERWVRTVPFEQVYDEEQCVRWTTGGRNVELDRRGVVEHSVSERLVGVMGCGVLGYFTPEGEPLDLTVPDVVEDVAVRQVRPLTDGGFAVSAGGWGSAGWYHRVLDGSGAPRFEVEGRLLDPWATSGESADVTLVAQEGTTVALGADGAEVWRAQVRSLELLARTGGVAVLLDDRQRVVALDLADGTVLWMRDDLVGGPVAVEGEGRSGEVQSVFTDGSVVAVVAPVYTDAAVVSAWRAFDVSTGEDLWGTALAQEGWGVDLAVDGHLLRWWPTGLAGMSS